jgi:DNA polymerase
VRGIPVDIKAAKFLIKRKEHDKAHAVNEAEKLAGRTSGGALVLSSNDAFVTYFEKTFNVELPNARQLTIDAMDFSNHPKADEIEHVLYVRKLLVARAGDKAQQVLNHAINDRVYDATVFHAAGTGRYQSWGINFFNFSRQSVKNWEKEKNSAPVPALQRGIVCAPKGKTLIESDWRGIENYLSLYYAGDKEQLARIEAGESPYLIFAEKMYGEKITKEDERYTLAKASVLGFGYGARPKKFALINNFDLATSTRLHDAWTKINAPIVRMWKDFENAFSFALLHGKNTTVRGFMFEQLGKSSVKITLPDGHVLYYRNLEVKTDDYGRPRIMREAQPIHGGLLTENLMQATCARLLYRALDACEKNGLECILHVYDSIMIEAFTKIVKKNAAMLEQIMKDPPSWAKDLKLAVDIKIGKRWSK